VVSPPYYCCIKTDVVPWVLAMWPFIWVFIMLFATLFTVLSLDAEGVSVVAGTLGPFLQSRVLVMGIIAVLFIILHVRVACARDFASFPRDIIIAPLMNRMWPILGVYAVMIFVHHLLGRHTIGTSRLDQLLMGGSLLGFRLALEIRLLLRWLRGESQATSVRNR